MSAGSSSDTGDDGAAQDPPIPFSTAKIEQAASFNVVGHGDLWPSCWSDDDEVYTAWGDGRGFAPEGTPDVDIGVARLTGSPFTGSVVGTNLAIGDALGPVWSGSSFYRKPTGMVCVDGDIYMAVQDLDFVQNEAPAATIVRSSDKGKTWTWDPAAPMFGGHVFTTIFFLDYGKDKGRPLLHGSDQFVYAYGLDHNWRDSFNDKVPDPTQLFLARVPKGSIQDRATWEFFAGLDGDEPRWVPDIAGRAPVIDDPRRIYSQVTPNFRPQDPKNMTVLSQGSVVYNASLERYIYTSWTEYTFEFYESATPWGPWKLFLREDYGDYPWSHEKHGGYATTIPSKFISADGKTMYVQSNTFMGGPHLYTVSLRKLSIEPYVVSEPNNAPGEPIPTANGGAVPIASAFHGALSFVLGDGIITGQSEDSWTGEVRAFDFWGYVWPRPYRFDHVVYTTGAAFADGGWFESLGVEVRIGGHWEPVSNVQVDPPYPMSADAGAHRSYTLRFDPLAGDGVRIVGKAGGSAAFTTISDLAVGYDG